MTEARRYPKVRLNQPWDLVARTVLNNAVSGKLNVVGDLTLTPNAASTILSDPAITRASFIGLMPMTANAAVALAGLYFDQTQSGGVLVRHANNALIDRIYRYIVIG